ncbi:MAG TPA: sulfate adenylyltransferase [Candidatus Omnitrophota bacterium]|nr:sulfate adenylyltransferase [Candidatus Omnitrophota bacterium]
MIGNTKIICTIGPSSNNSEVLSKLKNRGVDFFRINLSHTEEEDIDKRIREIINYGVPIIIDTEGSQIRSGNTGEITFSEGNIIKLFSEKIECDSENLFLNPQGIVKKLNEGDLISIDFNSVLLRVFDTSPINEGYVLCEVVIGGLIGGKKAVLVDSPLFILPPFSKKDMLAVEIAKKHNIKHFTLSFMEDPESVSKFRRAYPEAVVYSKIESKKGLKNFLEIAKMSEGVLVDRGDLSSQIPLERIPFIQKMIIKKVRDMGKETFIATNTLEQMSIALKPSKAEVNDIINTLLDGASGIALTKETAVGKYPVETVNMLALLIKQIDFLENKKEDLTEIIANSQYSDNVSDMLVRPHGGHLVNRFFPNYKGIIPEKKIEINEETLMDIEQIAVGAFSPLEGFMKKEDIESVANNMRLLNGTIWPIPIMLTVREEEASGLNAGQDIALSKDGIIYAILHLDEVYTLNKRDIAMKIYGTLDETHPGVKRFLDSGNIFLGGKISLIKKRISENKIHELTPAHTRKIFSERGWSKVVGFHTRNVIHKSHEFVQLEGLKRGLCDGLFIHPVVGKKKSGDFESSVIIESYEKMIKDFYPKTKVVFGTLATYSRYAGPREAVFTALIRKNFGCSHFIVGRDHTGVGNFYGPKDSHKIFTNFTKEELGMEIIKFDNVFYSDLENKYVHEPDFIDYPEENRMNISGTQAREMLKKGIRPPEWFMRPEISDIIIEKIKNGERVFVE